MNKCYYETAIIGLNLPLLTFSYEQKIDIGKIVLVNIKNKIRQAVVIKEVNKPIFKTNDILEVSSQYFNNNSITLAKFISNYYVTNLSISLKLFVPFDKNIKKENIDCKIDDNIKLSNEQQKVFEFTKNNKISLIFGDTGSGKTEIYIKLIKEQLLNNKQALLLMPEISLTPQIEKRLYTIFGDIIGIWHSKITKKKKNDLITNLLKGKIKLIIGARSALFLPFDNLGIIIVDEEHDSSYKSEQSPKINVKDLSIYVGDKFDIKVVLGSATPSINSYYKIKHIRLKNSFFKSKKSFIFDNSELGFNDLIIDKIKQTLNNNNQVIIFLPTRANFKYQICSNCGKSIECPFCSVSLSLYKNNKILKCHYCNYATKIPSVCPNCNNGIIKNYRLGTEEAKDILSNIFKDKKIAIFDRNNITTISKLKKVLNEFNDNKIDILIGTQMISKGHDYHNVKLAIILGIDSILNQNSFSSFENGISTMIQIAGRSGRKDNGEVIIQSKQATLFENYIKDYEIFLKDELKNRKNLYPPFVKLARVIFAHKNHKIAQEQMGVYLNLANKFDIEIIGAKECEIFKIFDKYRYEIFIRSKKIKPLLQFLHSINSNIASIDIDVLK